MAVPAVAAAIQEVTPAAPAAVAAVWAVAPAAVAVAEEATSQDDNRKEDGDILFFSASNYLKPFQTISNHFKLFQTTSNLQNLALKTI